ncbi:LOW QUALITY PROTEIN: Ribonuclease H-like domain containing protein [Trema orientale]|uniref:Ribonuclease H-like domain containing protein n=1 Tax=Trema orientale TaxID=63057 RepID=A0A2P5B8Y7_TREOI|nr:LOW QUALITY PROTEIN: Ribonuclease H-like domain containing protein [Trema orientale]
MRPDLGYAISVVSRFMLNPGKVHWEALKWILRYLKGPLESGLLFQRQEIDKDAVTGYVDSNYAGNVDTRKSLIGYVFTLFGTVMSWKSSLQSVMALSTTKAEYIAIIEAIKEALWLKRIITELGVQEDQVIVYCDNQSIIHLTKH